MKWFKWRECALTSHWAARQCKRSGGKTPWAASETEETEAFPGIASLQNGLHEIA